MIDEDPKRNIEEAYAKIQKPLLNGSSFKKQIDNKYEIIVC